MLTNNGYGSSRNSALDGLRGIAILTVILCHGSILGPNQTESSIAKLLLVVFDFGWAGVDLFFVLSGYLITKIILSTRNNEGWMKSFFIKRVLRILPIYFLFLALLLLLSYTIMDQRGDFLFIREYQIYFWFMLQNFLTLINMNWAPSLFYNGHLWTLAVEWQFYMIWPFIAGRFSQKSLTILCFLVIVAALISRIILWQLDTHISVIYTLTNNRMDSIAIGALVALSMQSNIDRKVIRKLSDGLIIIGVVFILVTFYVYGRASYYVPLMHTVGYTLLAMFFAGIILKVAPFDEETKLRAILSNRYLTVTGKYSYAMYIIHLPLMNSFGNYVRGFISNDFYAQLIYLPIVFIATLLIALASWKIVEAPALSYAQKQTI